MARLNIFLPLSFAVLFFAIVGASHLTHQEDEKPSVRSLTDHELRMGEEAGYSYVDRLTQLEEELIAQGIYVKEGSHMSRMAKFKQPSPRVMELSRQNARVLETTRFLKNELGLSDEELQENLMRYTNEADSSCLTAPTCTTSKYRMYDGSCNNQALTNLGQASTVFRRYTTPVYADGVSDPRNASVNGSALPGPREISLGVFGSTDTPLSSTTSLLMQFGQLINHDMESSTQFTLSNGTAITCCSSTNGALDASVQSPYCMPITISTTDPFINGGGTVIRETCMNFVRSSTGPSRLNCNQASVTYANQLNSNSHWLDGSVIYGSDNTTASSLREASGTGYLLQMSTDSIGRQLLPVTSGCTTGACFYAGDSRVTEQPQLTVMQTLWAREHNRVAKILVGLNPTWSNESVFQEARRIVVAEIQHITYNEFLPNLLGSTVMSQWGLSPLSSGSFSNFTNYTSGPISNEFATAAFRMGHSLVQGTVNLYDSNGTLSTYTMSDYFNDASVVYSNATFIDSVIRGLVTQVSQTVDRFVTIPLWLNLFRPTTAIFGFDIVALNIQRGRDHGLPSYNTFRQLCGYSNLTSFSDLTQPTRTLNSLLPTVSNKVASLLQAMYSDVNDIDLFVGGLAENSTLLGGVVGPTFSCLIAENFYKLKYGDRYFYELGGQAHSFSSNQLTEIKKASMARILCDNQDGSVTSMQPQAFVVTNTGTNAQVSCSSITSLNLNYWAGETLY